MIRRTTIRTTECVALRIRRHTSGLCQSQISELCM